jgi:acyl-CoA reductase-like NAD-dependent aldehyde dehydrogenase
MTDVVAAPARASGLNYVGGDWAPSASGETYAKLHPMRPSETTGEFSSSAEADAEAAVGHAEAAIRDWSRLPMARRAGYLTAAAAALEARAEQVARDMSTEIGKPLRESRGEAARAAQILRFAASKALRNAGEHFEQALTPAPVSTRRPGRRRRADHGDPLDPEVDVGPIVNESQFDDVMAAIDCGRNEGGHVAAGGGRADRAGYLVEPTVFEDVSDSAYLSCQEVFGPVTSLYRFETLDEALRRANAVEFGLSAGILTSSLAAAIRFAGVVEAGLVHVNSQTAGADVHVPFGGIKASGLGPHEQGRAAIEFYTETLTVYVDP